MGVLGGKSQPVYSAVSPGKAGRNAALPVEVVNSRGVLGGRSIPVYFVPEEQLKSNGGDWPQETGSAIPIVLDPVDRKKEPPFYAIPVYYANGGGNVPSGSLYDSLVAFWTMEEASGVRADSIGSFDLTENTAVASEAGLVYDNAASPSGAFGNYMSNNDSGLQVAGEDFWISFWFFCDGITIADYIMQSFDWAFQVSSNRLLFETYQVGGVVDQTSTIDQFTLSTWVLAFGWHTNGINHVSFNVTTPVSEPVTSGPSVEQSILSVGTNNTGGAGYNGRIGPLMVGRGYVPTEDDRTWLYNSGAGRTLAEIEAYSG